MNPILIVDDNEQILKILTQYVEAEGWPYLTARSGEEALSLFDAASPSLMLLDIMLPGIDGLEVCRRIRSISNIPILMITAKDEDADRILGLDIGADDYIVKPFSPGEVMARIRKYPAIGYLVVSIFPLIPGAGVYYTMSYAVQGQMDKFAAQGMYTAAIAGVLAVGILLVSTVFRMINNVQRRRKKK